MNQELQQLGKQAKAATRQLMKLASDQKNQALKFIAETIMEREPNILAANDRDLEAGEKMGLSESLLDRLKLSPQRLEGIANDVLKVAQLPDPVGEEFESRVLGNGLRISKRRIPIGVIGVIYESRPNVTVDIAALSLKSGNAAILRGGKEALHTNRAFAKAVMDGCVQAGLPEHTMQLIQSTDRSLVKEMLQANQYIDMIIPRGGPALQKFAIDNATMPVITGGVGICHIYVDAKADPDKVSPIVVNAKVQRPSVCNAMDTLLVHQSVAKFILPQVARALAEYQVELRCEPRAYKILRGFPDAIEAGVDDFDTEFLSLKAAVKVVDNLDETLDHIYEHSTKHSEAIITEDYSAAMRFVNELDSSAVFVNASTRFNDGGQFGMGAEVAISTQRLHARGPMGLYELTTYKWVVLGNGQIRI
ncbi:MAG TPA: glutamate-5-semialdehyde dehydrogenase [Chloroflexi bacterium]|nr:MAG: glutamate-5-semialdehyde dehydrogenase [Anaerolineaceae bacterium 4572_5.2]HEY86233.1 glutamate-5-semialdehyde dehydrogenase [Chloroflexota bacterium]